MSAQNGRGHGQPPKKGLGENLILGANQVDLVDSQAPPNSNGLLPCKVVLKRIDVSNSKKANRPHKMQLTPCVVSLNDCLKIDIHRLKKLKVQHCGHAQCKTCPILDTKTKIISTVTHREYPVFSPDVLCPLGCKTRNVIYLLSCQGCGYQYVGETGRPLHKRINGHRSSVRKKEGLRGRHFAKEGHHFRVQIIEKIIPKQGESDTDLRERREAKELEWQKNLGTVWPFGLNDRVKGIGCLTKKYSKIGNSSQLITTQSRPQRKHGNRKHHNKSYHEHVTVDFLKDIFAKVDGLHLLRSLLYSIPHYLLSKLHEEVSQLYIRRDISKPIYYILKDIANHRLFKPVTTHENKTKPVFIKIFYRDRGIDLINLPNILHNKKVQSLIPPYFDATMPTVSYKYTKTISSSIFNHIKTVSEFELDKFTAKEYMCDCQNSPFISNDHGHVITGNLEIISNVALRKLISKGPKFREQNKIAWGKDKKIILDAIENHAKSWAKKENSDISVLDEWTEEIRAIVNTKIRKLQRQVTQPPDPILTDKDVKTCLEQLHDKYVFVPADKAANNVIIICKHFYLSVIVKELGLLQSDVCSNTYEKVDKSVDEVVDSHLEFLEKFNLRFTGKHKNLPRIYSIPKLHKNPYKFRFIAGSKFCSTKELSVLLTKGLQKIQEFWYNYCGRIEATSGINRFWITKNSTELLNTLLGNKKRRFEDITTWDFSTLYTTIPHADLKKCIQCLVLKVFRKNHGKKLIVTSKTAFFGTNVGNGQYGFDEAEFLELFEFLIDNIYIRFGSDVFRQVVGIPMGTNCAPLLANLYLFYHEYHFLNTLKSDKDKKYHCRLFKLTYRFIDDLLSVNNKMFKKYVSSIYPKDLELKETTESDEKCSFLDLLLFKDDGELKCRVYDKRDDFNFNIVNYPFMESNIPINPAYGVYVSRLIAFARICTDFKDFAERHKLLASKLLKQGFSKQKLKKVFLKFVNKYQEVLIKYHVNFSEHINIILSDND